MKYAKRVQEYINYETVQEAVDADGFNIVQPKLDGWWACAEIKKGIARIYSRQGVKKIELPAERMPDCVVLGEYLVGTQRSVNDEKCGALVVFDALTLGTADMTGGSYQWRMSWFDTDIDQHAPAWMHRVRSWPIKQAKAVWKKCVIDGHAEGLIFRSERHTYHRGRIGRVKKTFTMDYVVMGVERGQGRHSRRAGAVICGLYEGRKLVEKVRVGGGWTDAQRDELFANPKAFIGRVLEVKGWQVFESGSMRHPNAVRFRDDKKAKECVFHGTKEG